MTYTIKDALSEFFHIKPEIRDLVEQSLPEIMREVENIEREHGEDKIFWRRSIPTEIFAMEKGVAKLTELFTWSTSAVHDKPAPPSTKTRFRNYYPKAWSPDQMEATDWVIGTPDARLV